MRITPIPAHAVGPTNAQSTHICMPIIMGPSSRPCKYGKYISNLVRSPDIKVTIFPVEYSFSAFLLSFMDF